MKISALIPLILAIHNSVDFLNLIPNVEEHNIEFVEELGSTRQHSGIEFDLDVLVADLAARGTRQVF